MADSQGNMHDAGGSKHRRLSRLQMRAPSSLQVNRSCDWNVAIPLLSPLRSSPPPAELTVPVPVGDEARRMDQSRQQLRHQGPEPEKMVFKKWQHPAAPFSCEPTSLVPPFFSCR